MEIFVKQLKKLGALDLCADSRLIKSGDVFVAYPGAKYDARHAILAAVSQGAVAILAEGQDGFRLEVCSIPIFYIDGLANKIGALAALFYDNPSEKMTLMGVTGTNGKTSCTHFLAQALQPLNKTPAILGTLGNGLYGHLIESTHTTLDAVTLQKQLADFYKKKASHVAMEVSSHGIEQKRIAGVDFEIGIFTNLSRDHLDYHGDFQTYANVKKQFLCDDTIKKVVINADDAMGQQFISELKNKKKVFSYSVQHPADCYATDIQQHLSGITITVHSIWGKGVLPLPLFGLFNVSNVLAVMTTLCALDFNFEAVKQALLTLKPVPGRMEFIRVSEKPLIIIDYAHTPDALLQVLRALKTHTEGRLFCIFGCGGDRDRGKRPEMGKIAETYSDRVWISDDNPRFENPAQIVQDILTGISSPEKIVIQHNREKAISDAILSAAPQDVILIAGKGAETYQIIGGEKYPFNDLAVVNDFFHLR